jgi:hypothetical protein
VLWMAAHSARPLCALMFGPSASRRRTRAQPVIVCWEHQISGDGVQPKMEKPVAKVVGGPQGAASTRSGNGSPVPALAGVPR